MKTMRVQVTEDGEVILPAEFVKAIGACPGDRVTLALEGDEVRAFTPATAIRKAQEWVAEHFPGDRSLVDELIAERRAEAAREQ